MNDISAEEQEVRSLKLDREGTQVKVRKLGSSRIGVDRDRFQPYMVTRQRDLQHTSCFSGL
jgi:hypothetical protein